MHSAIHKTKYLFLAVVSAVFFIPTSILYAQGIKNAGSVLGQVAEPAGVTDRSDLGEIVGLVISSALTLVGIIFLLLMVYAGYLWMTARGESDQVDKARKIIIAALIGLVIVSSAYAITIFVTGRFGTA